MKFKFKPLSKEDVRKRTEWKSVLLGRRLIAAAESSSSAASGRGNYTPAKAKAYAAALALLFLGQQYLSDYQSQYRGQSILPAERTSIQHLADPALAFAESVTSSRQYQPVKPLEYKV